MENNKELAFEKCEAIRNLNKVEGFNPLDYVTSSINNKDEEYINLETKYRQLWFRLCYPQGKVTKKFLRLTDAVAAVEARVYLDKNDPEDNYVASGVAQRFYNGNSDFGLYYLESAETIAEGRALGKAGFGVQFCDFDGQKDDAMPDTGIKVQNTPGLTGNPAQKSQVLPSKDKAADGMPSNQKDTAQTPEQPAQAKDTTANGNTTPQNSNNATQPDLHNNGSQSEQPTNSNESEQKAAGNTQAGNTQSGAAEAPQNVQNAPIEQQNIQNAPTEQQSIQNEPVNTIPEGKTDDNGVKYDESTPVEEILKVMTADEAEKIVITVGFNRGKTLRQLYLANYRQLKWLFESYNGDNNILRAGAKLLFDLAQQQQQKAS